MPKEIEARQKTDNVGLYPKRINVNNPASFSVPAAALTSEKTKMASATTMFDTLKQSPYDVSNILPVGHTPIDSFVQLPQVSDNELRTANVRQVTSTCAPNFYKSESPSDYQLQALTSLIQNERDMPKLEVLKFNGDPSKYIKFIHTFEETVDAANSTFRKKLLYLV